MYTQSNILCNFFYSYQLTYINNSTISNTDNKLYELIYRKLYLINKEY
jgi:hypothetical protein